MYQAGNDEFAFATLPLVHRTNLCRDVHQASLLLQGKLLHDEDVSYTILSQMVYFEKVVLMVDSVNLRQQLVIGS